MIAAHLPLSNSSGYQLIPIRLGDSEEIRLWRNSQLDVLRQHSVLSKSQQERYFATVVTDSLDRERPPLFLCSYLLNGALVGYGGLTHIDWQSKRAELSYLASTERANDEQLYRDDFLNFLQLLTLLAFDRVSLHRLYAEAFSFRNATIAFLEQYGFQREGVLRQHTFKRGAWQDSLLLGLLAHEWRAIYSPHEDM